MANFSLTKNRYRALFRKLLPLGWAWNAEPDGAFDKFLNSLASEPARVELRGYDLIKELDPYQTFEMLDNWERLLGIPDECTPEGYNPGLSERRYRIVQKLAMIGGQSPDFFKNVARMMGYDIDVYEVLNYRAFRVGISRVGEPLTNGIDWAFAFQVKAPAEFARYFRVGLSTVGERLVIVENSTLECIIRKFAPAHTVPVFSYTL